MESGLVLRPPGLCSDCLWGTALSCSFHVSIGQPLGKQPLGRGSRALCLPPAWPVLCCGRWNPPYCHHSARWHCPPLLPPVPLLVPFSLDPWRQEQVLIKCPSEADRRELMEGSPTARACVGLPESGRKLKEHSRWVRLKRHSGASEVECVVSRGGEPPTGESWNESSSECRGVQQTPSCPQGLLLHRRRTLAPGDTGGCEPCGTWKEGLEAILSHWLVFFNLLGPECQRVMSPVARLGDKTLSSNILGSLEVVEECPGQEVTESG